MPDDRWVRILAAMDDSRRTGPSSLCALATGLLGVSGAGIAVLSEVGAHRMTVCSSDPVAQLVEDLQFSLGEGPCVDAFDQDRPISEPDLAAATPSRWPGFSPAALAGGAAAVFGFPLRSGGVRLGALNLYQRAAGELSGEQHADALVVADVIAREIVHIQAGADRGTVSSVLLDDSGMRVVVYQASGMVAVQLGVSVEEALLRIRAHAYSQNLPVSDVANQVVDRTFSFE